MLEVGSCLIEDVNVQSKEISIFILMQVKGALIKLRKSKSLKAQKTNKVVNHRILILVKENLLTTSAEMKNTQQKVQVSLSKSRDTFMKGISKGFTTRCEPLATFKNSRV